MADLLEDLFRSCTVRVTGGPTPGAGFFIAPGKVMTCAHVVGDAPTLTVRWERDAHTPAEFPVTGPPLIVASRGRPIPALDHDYPDIAILDIPVAEGHPCVRVDPEWPARGDEFQVFGYPREGGAVRLTPARLTYRGTQGTTPTAYLDLASDTIKPGMSGAPVLNLRTGGVCGIIVASKHVAQPDGALAIPWQAITSDLRQLLAANQAFHERDLTWDTTTARREALSGGYVAGRAAGPAEATSPETDASPFVIVDREYLAEQSQKPKRMYVARSPDWADVVHGFDPELRFIERDQTSELYSAVRDELLEPCRRGADSQLHSLFVLGAPGGGKTTLVRRVAAMLVRQGECVVADFGVNTERVYAEDVDAYISALDRLSRHGVPVLVLLDDPFFANSGWVELLHALSRPHHRYISVLAASPNFLFERFAHSLLGRRVVGRTFDLSRPSTEERKALALLHHREPSESDESEEDLLVVAMEAAAGESFHTIIQRMWMTLNGGIPLSPTTDHRRLPWPVVAFAVTCYFHRNYVLCPEPLLREFLLNALIETPPSYLSQELQELVTREGWHIFSVNTSTAGQAGSLGLIGSTHARVAREAWRHFPLRSLNVEKTVVDVSARVPEAGPQLAQLILALQSAPTVGERRSANRFAARWSQAVEQGTVDTRAVCALVRQLKPSRAARLQFRGALRKCLTAQDSQSWLAAWQLYHMASASAHPQEREFLLKVSLPWTLKIADLSTGPREAIEIAARLGDDAKRTVIERLIASLRGELEWRVDGAQVAWLIDNLPGHEVTSLLDVIYSWLENGLLIEEEAGQTSDADAVNALVGFLGVAPELDEVTTGYLFETVFDWLLAAPEPHPRVVLRLLQVAEGRVAADDPSAVALLAQVLDLLRQRPDSSESVWSTLIMLVRQSPALSGRVPEIAQVALEWLLGRPENNELAWSALLALVRQSPALYGQVPEIAGKALEWLLGRPESNESVWAVLLALVRESPALAGRAEEIARKALEWLRARPESNESAWSALLFLAGQSPALTAQIVPETLKWLRGRSESNENAWAVLLALVRQSPALSGQAEEIAQVVLEWLLARPESNENVWASLLALVRQSPALAGRAEEIARKSLEWLRARPESNESAWTALLTLVRQSPALGGQIVPEAFKWLKDRPENNESVWSALLPLAVELPILAGQAPTLAGQIIPETFEWLRTRPGRHVGAWYGLTIALASSLEIDHRHRREMLHALREWIVQYLGPGSSLARGVEILILTDSHDGNLMPMVNRELRHVEQSPSPELVIVYSLTYAVTRIRDADLSARMNSWVQRYLAAHQAESSGYLSLIALVPRALAQSAE